MEIPPSLNNLESRIHLHPSFVIEQKKDNYYLNLNGKNIVSFNSFDSQIKIEESIYNSDFGNQKPNQCIVMLQVHFYFNI